VFLTAGALFVLLRTEGELLTLDGVLLLTSGAEYVLDGATLLFRVLVLLFALAGWLSFLVKELLLTAPLSRVEALLLADLVFTFVLSLRVALLFTARPAPLLLLTVFVLLPPPLFEDLTDALPRVPPVLVAAVAVRLCSISRLLL